jgi:hypothetical protein
VGLPCERFGEAPTGFVALSSAREDQSVAETLDHRCREALERWGRAQLAGALDAIRLNLPERTKDPPRLHALLKASRCPTVDRSRRSAPPWDRTRFACRG